MTADGALCFHKKFRSAGMALRFAARGLVLYGTIQEPRLCWHCGDFRLFPSSEEEELRRLVEAGCIWRSAFQDESHAETHRQKANEKYGKDLVKWGCDICGNWHIGDEAPIRPEKDNLIHAEIERAL